MDLDDYQTRAVKFAIHPKGIISAGYMGHSSFGPGSKGSSPNENYQLREIPIGLLYAALGLGEVGELQGKIKKIIRDGSGILSTELREAIAAELGDVLWYVADVARELGYPLSTIAEGNLGKLTSRAERGTLGGSGDNR